MEYSSENHKYTKINVHIMEMSVILLIYSELSTLIMNDENGNDKY